MSRREETKRWNFLTWLEKPIPPTASRLLLAGIVLLALLLRGLWLYLEPAINKDGAIYLHLANQWIKTGVYPEHDYLPLFPFFIKSVSALGLDSRAAASVVLFIMGSAVPILAYGVVRLCTARREIALGAALLAAVNPSAIDLACKIQRDTPYLFFAGSAIFLSLLAVKRRKFYWWAAASLALALGIFCRYETFELVAATGVCFFVAFCVGRGNRASIALHAFVWGISLCAFLVLIAFALDVEAQLFHAWIRRFQRILLWNC